MFVKKHARFQELYKLCQISDVIYVVRLYEVGKLIPNDVEFQYIITVRPAIANIPSFKLSEHFSLQIEYLSCNSKEASVFIV